MFRYLGFLILVESLTYSFTISEISKDLTWHNKQHSKGWKFFQKIIFKRYHYQIW